MVTTARKKHPGQTFFPYVKFYGTWVIGLALVIAIAGMLGSCGDTQEVRVLDVLQPAPCAPPCWQNITPGKTYLDEAVQALSSSPFVEAETIEVVQIDHSLRGIGSVISWRGTVDGSIAVTKEGIVSDITMPFYSDAEVSIDGLIQLYGSPLVDLRAVPVHWNKARFVLYVYYPQRGLFLITRFVGPRHANPVVPSLVSVELIQYVTPQEYYQTLQVDPRCAIPWDGYKESSYYCMSGCVSVVGVGDVCPPLK